MLNRILFDVDIVVILFFITLYNTLILWHLILLNFNTCFLSFLSRSCIIYVDNPVANQESFANDIPRLCFET